MGYFTIKELCDSSTAKKYHIDNTPSKTVESHLQELITFLNPLREKWGSAIKVNSGYRSPQLNAHPEIGGSVTSVHMIGYAADLWPVNGKFDDFRKFVQEYMKDKKFDQCIIEKNSKGSRWIHIGLYNNVRMQRRQIFSKTQ